MAAATHKLQAPKGTRDWYPEDLARRRHVEAAWRSASIDCGFEEIDGPTFEHLELYTIKSGPGIVTELFSFTRAGGDDVYALRPEFTPTLARMVAARAAQLPMPIRWFTIPSMFRAERPQRGRLREFMQWNVDLIGVDGPDADAEVIECAVLAMDRLGLTPQDVYVGINHRGAIEEALRNTGTAPEAIGAALALLDRRAKMEPARFLEEADRVGLSRDSIRAIERLSGLDAPSRDPSKGLLVHFPEAAECLGQLWKALEARGIADWCRPDTGIVRGLAYYTGMVFEIHEASGAERAIAGGGRYDTLVELFGGPKLPACGFGMGDVVLSLVLGDRQKLETGAEYLARPDVFLVSAGTEAADAELPRLVSSLRRRGVHVRRSHRSTRNVGKLLGEASKARARFAVILDDGLANGLVTLKDLDAGTQREVKKDDLERELKERS